MLVLSRETVGAKEALYRLEAEKGGVEGLSYGFRLITSARRFLATNESGLGF